MGFLGDQSLLVFVFNSNWRFFCAATWELDESLGPSLGCWVSGL